MKINHRNIFSYHAKGHLLTFQRVIKKISVYKLPDAQVFLDEVDTTRFSHHFHICLTRLANNKISPFKIKIFLPFSCKIDWRLGLYFPSQNEDHWWKHVFLLRRRAFSDFLQTVIPDPQVSLKEIDNLVREKCFYIDDLHLKSSWFIQAN